MKSYYLQRGVHLSLIGDVGVLLDLRSGNYLGLGAEQVSALSHCIQGWPGGLRSATARAPAEIRDLVASMMAHGLLTDDIASSRSADPIVLDPVEAALVSISSLESGPRPRIQHWLLALLACLNAHYLLKFRSLGTIFAAVHRRKVRWTHSGARLDPAATRALLIALFQIRPYLYTVSNNCLFDSLVLITFLSYYRIFPDWVIGVKTDPFSAHSWVQHGKYVLNGRAGHINQYTPIAKT